MRSRRFICVKGVRECFPDKHFVGFRASGNRRKSHQGTLDAQLAKYAFLTKTNAVFVDYLQVNSFIRKIVFDIVHDYEIIVFVVLGSQVLV